MKTRSFSEILQESQRTYQFILGFAGDLPDDFEEKLESSLQKYQLVSLSTGRQTPIQQRPLDFPQRANCSATYYDIEVQYPVTQQVLANYLQNNCQVQPGSIVVRSPNEPLELYQVNSDEKTTYEPLLTQGNMGGESAQNDVGDNRVMELLKELEKSREERSITYTYGLTGTSEDIGSQENTASVQGN